MDNTPRIKIASHVLTAIALLLAVVLHLLPALIAGLPVYMRSDALGVEKESRSSGAPSH